MSKKHQRADEDESFKSGDQNQNGAKCTHIERAIDLNSVKKSVSTSGFLTDCEDCKKQPPVSDLAQLKLRHRTSLPFPQPKELSLLWLCLKCGNQACGRRKNMHALMHFETQDLYFHCMCVDTTSWRIWCYECNNEVNIICNKKLQEMVEYLKKVKANPNKQVPTPTIADKVVMDKNFVFPLLESSPIYTNLLSSKSKYILEFCKYEDGFTIAKANPETFVCDMEEYIRGKLIFDISCREIPMDFKFEPGEAIKLKELQKDFRNRLNI